MNKKTRIAITRLPANITPQTELNSDSSTTPQFTPQTHRNSYTNNIKTFDHTLFNETI